MEITASEYSEVKRGLVEKYRNSCSQDYARKQIEYTLGGKVYCGLFAQNDLICLRKGHNGELVGDSKWCCGPNCEEMAITSNSVERCQIKAGSFSCYLYADGIIGIEKGKDMGSLCCTDKPRGYELYIRDHFLYGELLNGEQEGFGVWMIDEKGPVYGEWEEGRLRYYYCPLGGNLYVKVYVVDEVSVLNLDAWIHNYKQGPPGAQDTEIYKIEGMNKLSAFKGEIRKGRCISGGFYGNNKDEVMQTLHSLDRIEEGSWFTTIKDEQERSAYYENELYCVRLEKDKTVLQKGDEEIVVCESLGTIPNVGIVEAILTDMNYEKKKGEEVVEKKCSDFTAKKKGATAWRVEFKSGEEYEGGGCISGKDFVKDGEGALEKGVAWKGQAKEATVGRQERVELEAQWQNKGLLEVSEDGQKDRVIWKGRWEHNQFVGGTVVVWGRGYSTQKMSDGLYKGTVELESGVRYEVSFDALLSIHSYAYRKNGRLFLCMTKKKPLHQFRYCCNGLAYAGEVVDFEASTASLPPMILNATVRRGEEVEYEGRLISVFECYRLAEKEQDRLLGLAAVSQRLLYVDWYSYMAEKLKNRQCKRDDDPENDAYSEWVYLPDGKGRKKKNKSDGVDLPDKSGKKDESEQMFIYGRKQDGMSLVFRENNRWVWMYPDVVYERDGNQCILWRRDDGEMMFKGKVTKEFKPSEGRVYLRVAGVECESEYIDKLNPNFTTTLKRKGSEEVIYEGGVKVEFDMNSSRIDCFGKGEVRLLNSSIKGFFVSADHIETGERVKKMEGMLETVERGRFDNRMLTYGFVSKGGKKEIKDNNWNKWEVEEKDGVYRKKKMVGNMYATKKRIWCFGEEGSSPAKEFCTVLDEKDRIDFSADGKKVTITRHGVAEREEYAFQKVKVRFQPTWMELCDEEEPAKEAVCCEKPVEEAMCSVTCEQEFEEEPLGSERSQETQETQAPLEELEVPTEPPQPRYSISEKSAPIDPDPAPRPLPVPPEPHPLPVPPVPDEPIDWEAMWDEVGQYVQSGDQEGLQDLLLMYRSLPHEEAAQLAQYIQEVLEEKSI